ncbi:HalOD1 output domain-containing protein [Haloprofundus halobius]|uniref:HalOD1 output domain-containing protein n=1 Tax=Haloprofundus halobius TaxID=2876194 RepID=UPI001CCB2469|nr:HalOD1 output domain-containing protein [Haloprofundus halobius]
MSTQNHVSSASVSNGYCALFNPYVDSVVEELVETVSSIRGATPVELSPLYPVVDPDALESLFGRSNARERESHYAVTFEYEEFEVTIRSGGCMTLDPTEAT